MSSAAPLDFVHRACSRAASCEYQRLSSGLYTLAIIARTASWFGIFATCFQVAFSFKGLGTEKSVGMAYLTHDLSLAVVPTALGIAVALLASWIHKLLATRLDCINLEMKSAMLDLMNALHGFRLSA